jgi:hypothetical protein
MIIWLESMIDSSETIAVDGVKVPSSTLVRISPTTCRAVADVLHGHNYVFDWEKRGRDYYFYGDQASILQEEIGWIALRERPENLDFLCYNRCPLVFSDAQCDALRAVLSSYSAGYTLAH